MAEPPPRIVFDTSAGEGRTISEDGACLTTVGPSSNIFRGRSIALHTGPGVAVDLVLEVGGAVWCCDALHAAVRLPSVW